MFLLLIYLEDSSSCLMSSSQIILHSYFANIEQTGRHFQAIIASAFAKGDYHKVMSSASRVLQYVAATHPINALAFVFDGVNYGASDLQISHTLLIQW
ncbi:hypothetical protein RJT34_23927 [Clitoria ternatea]|uniref:Uncharacterized protein n=1 Tax=Clitoria ternatea TaxID=43366 RepID=A0AAN9IFE8_CLITE